MPSSQNQMQNCHHSSRSVKSLRSNLTADGPASASSAVSEPWPALLSPSPGQHRRLHISSRHILIGQLRPPSPGPATSSLSSDQSHRLRALATSAVSAPFSAPLSPDPDKLQSPAPSQLRRLQTCSSSTAVSECFPASLSANPG